MLRKALVRRIPLWILLLGIITTASIFAGLMVLRWPDFEISSSSPTLLALAKQGSSFDFTLKSLNGFTGVLRVEAIAPSNLNAHLSTDTVSLATFATLTLVIATSSVGNQTVKIVVSSGFISHSIILPVITEDLSISFIPPSEKITQSGSTIVVTTLASLNGLTGGFYLSADRYNCTCVGGYFPQPYVSLPRNGAFSTQMNVTVSHYPGNYSGPIWVYARSSSWEWETFYNVTVA